MDERSGGDAWGDDLAGPAGLLGGGSAGLAARLDAWLADARTERSADARARERWLSAAAEADATFAGVLLDLAERGAALAVTTTGGRRHQGHVEVLGADFVAVRVASGTEVLLSMAVVASVRTAPAEMPASGERVATTDLRLADVLAELAAERPRVLLVLRDGSDAVAGELRAVGQDVVMVRTDVEGAGTAYLPLDAVGEVTLG